MGDFRVVEKVQKQVCLKKVHPVQKKTFFKNDPRAHGMLTQVFLVARKGQKPAPSRTSFQACIFWKTWNCQVPTTARQWTGTPSKSQNALKIIYFATKNASKMGQKWAFFPKVIVDHLGCTNK